MKKQALLLAATCACLAMVGTAAAASPAASYRAKVNALCKKGVTRINAVPTPKSPTGYGAYFVTQARLGTQLLRQVTAVRPPVSLLPLVAKALTLQGKEISGVAVLAARIETGTDPVKALNAAKKSLQSLTVQSNAAWRKAGLTACVG